MNSEHNFGKLKRLLRSHQLDELDNLTSIAERANLKLLLGDKLTYNMLTASLTNELSVTLSCISHYISEVKELLKDLEVHERNVGSLHAYPIWAQREGEQKKLIGFLNHSHQVNTYTLTTHWGWFYRPEHRIRVLTQMWAGPVHAAANKIDLDVLMQEFVASPDFIVGTTNFQDFARNCVNLLRSVMDRFAEDLALSPEAAIANGAYTFLKSNRAILNENRTLVSTVGLHILDLINNQTPELDLDNCLENLHLIDWESFDQAMLTLGAGWIGSLGANGHALDPDGIKIVKKDGKFSIFIDEERIKYQNKSRHMHANRIKELQPYLDILEPLQDKVAFELPHLHQQSGMCPVVHIPHHQKLEGIDHMYFLVSKAIRTVLHHTLQYGES